LLSGSSTSPILGSGASTTPILGNENDSTEGAVLSRADLRKMIDNVSDEFKHRIVIVKRMEDRYRVLEKCGAGGFAVVYLVARHDDPAQTCAVKVVKLNSTPVYLRHGLAITRDFNLSGIALSMNHRNISSYLEFMVDESRPCAMASILPVMLPLRGADLFEWLAERQNNVTSAQASSPWISENEVAIVTKQIASGLAYIHSWTPHIVHRDVKPENLRWTTDRPDADLKLLDFGLVYVGGTVDELRGRRIGTTAYSSPEVLTGCLDGPPSPLNDMYSFGVILYLLLSAHFPWEEGSDRMGDLDTSSDPWPSVSANAIALVRQLLNPIQSERPTASTILESSWFKEADAGRLKKVAVSVPSNCADSLRFVSHMSNML